MTHLVLDELAGEAEWMGLNTGNLKTNESGSIQIEIGKTMVDFDKKSIADFLIRNFTDLILRGLAIEEAS